MSGEETKKPIDPFKLLHIVENDDGTLKRLYEFPQTAAASDDHNGSTPVITKDVILNPEHNTYVRIFLPRQALDNNASTTKLPLIVYYHCGGFIILHVDSTPIHDFCYNMAHRAYHVGLRVSQAVDDLEPLKIKGLLLHMPFFGATQRSESELRLIDDPVLPISSTDLMWKMSLPIGSDRDHEYSNPTVGDEFDQIKKLGWLIVVTGCDGDPLIDSQKKLVEMFKKEGIKVETQFTEGDYHAAELVNPTKANELFVYLSHFLEK